MRGALRLALLLALHQLAPGGAAQLSNIVFVLTDDQDIELGGVTPNVRVRRLIGDQGAVGEAFYVNTPICCPSRTEYLSGRMYHNVLTPDLSGCMHVDDKGVIFNETFGLFPMMQQAGYRTGGFGKIINGQKNIFCPKNPKMAPLTTGFDWLSVPCDEGDYFASQFFNLRPNGSEWQESLGQPTDVSALWYQTAQIGNRSLEFVRSAVAEGKPFLAYLGPHAPHYSADAPPWAQDLFEGMQAPRTPAYNTSIGQQDKTKHVAQNPPIDDEMEKWIDHHFRDRWRSIVGVDDMVGLVVAELERLQVLENTYIFYT
jgi:N-acetylglucosamine-6-sulfatase